MCYGIAVYVLFGGGLFCASGFELGWLGWSVWLALEAPRTEPSGKVGGAKLVERSRAKKHLRT